MTVPANAYEVKNLLVSTTPVTQGDKQVYVKVVRFNIGAHGPFVLRYTDPDTTTETITADINKQIHELRTLDNIRG